MTPELGSKPSISTSNWLSVCSRSSLTCAQMDAPLAADRVELVDEDEAGGLGLGLLEQVADPRGPDADEHLDELAAAQREEGHLGFAGHGTGQQRLAGPRRPEQENPLGNLGTQRLVALGMAEEVDDLHQLGLGLVAAGHVIEGDAGRLLGDQPRPALAEAQNALARGPDPPCQHPPEQGDRADRQQPRPEELREDPRAHAAELDPCFLEVLDELGIFDADAPKRERCSSGLPSTLSDRAALVPGLGVILPVISSCSTVHSETSPRARRALNSL